MTVHLETVATSISARKKLFGPLYEEAGPAVRRIATTGLKLGGALAPGSVFDSYRGFLPLRFVVVVVAGTVVVV